MYQNNQYFCDLCEEPKKESKVHLCLGCGCQFCNDCGNFKVIGGHTLSLCNSCLSKIDTTENKNNSVKP